MCHITKDVWDGTDYVPFVWQKWLEDPSGYLCVATWNGEVVGLHHVSMQSDGVAWAEGIRVDESMRGRGIGAAMLQHSLTWARAADCAMARLSTSSDNDASRRIAQKAGLREKGRFTVLSGATSAESVPALHVRLANAGDFEVLCRMAQARRPHEENAALYTEGWTAYNLSPERLQLLVAVHAIVIAEATETVAMGIATASVRRPFLRLGYLDGSVDGMTAVGAWMRAQAGDAGMEKVRAIVPEGASSEIVLQSLGFSSPAGFSMVVWEIEL